MMGGHSIFGRGAFLGGASVLAMLAGGLCAAPAAAQSFPGSAQCPIAGTVVTCTGNVATGFRAVNDAQMRELIIRDLTGPMTGITTAGLTGNDATPPIIDIIASNDLTVSLFAGVELRGQRTPRDTFQPVSAVYIAFDPAQSRTAVFNNAGLIDVTQRHTSFANINGAGVMILDAGSLTINNTGTIRISSTNSNERRYETAVIGDAVNSVALVNDGLISSSGTYSNGVVLRAANVSLVNNGTIDQGYNDGTAEATPLYIISESDSGAPLSIRFENSGTLSATRVMTSGGVAGQRTDSYIQQYGAGTIEFSNTGIIRNTEIEIQQQVGAGQDQVLDILNEGRLIGAGIGLANEMTHSAFEIEQPGQPQPTLAFDESFLYRATPAVPAGEARNVAFSLTNTGALEQATLRVVLERGTGNVSATIINSGSISRGATGGGSEIRADAEGSNASARVINSGPLDGVLLTSFAAGEGDGATTSSFLENTGTAIDSTFFSGISDFSVDGEGTAELINRGAIGSSAQPATAALRTDFQVQASAANAIALLLNTADIVNGIFTATSDTDNLGPGPALRLENSGDITNLVVGDIAILAASTRTIEVINSGDIFIQHDGTAVDQFNNAFISFGVGLSVSQGEMAFRDSLTSTTAVPGTRDVFGGLGRQPFGDQVRVTNSGAITIDGEGDFNWGVALRGYSDILFDNDGAISVRGENLDGGRANRGDGFDLVGVLVSGYSDLIFNNGAAITLDAVDAGPAGAAILLVERSFDSTLPGTRHSSYDAAADTNSRFEVNLAANVTANGADQFGLFGYIGLRDDGSITTARRNTDDFAGFQFTNNQATVVVDVASGVSLTGGSGIGSAIAIQGTGNLIITNAGSIIGRGGGQSAAIHVSSAAQLDPYLQFSLAPQTFQADRFVTLRDMVNTGIVRSDAGHGIWAELGAIVNLTNRGLIFGGVASVRALQTSSILNDTAGTLDGRILLEGAGSTLVNNGIIQVSTPGAVTHQINGNFTQDAGATLSMRLGDLMNVTGNFALNGDLDLALAAPTQTTIFTVGGNLLLDGLLNVTDAGGFGAGVYRLFNYGGTLTDNGLALGVLPGGANGFVQTAIVGQINLVVAGAGNLSIQFWDGADTAPDGIVDGGAGGWSAGATNWTNAGGTANDAWAGNFAVFQGTGGAVSVVGQQSATGLQFTSGGYVLSAGAGGGLTLGAAETVVRVDPGVSAELAVPLSGAGALVKRDTGILIVTGTNLYTGGTVIREGVLQISADAALGAAAGGVTLDGGTLRFAGAVSSARGFTVGAGGGTLDTGANATTLSGALGGTGGLVKVGTGTLTYSGSGGAYGGTFTVSAGTLRLDGTLGGTLLVGAGGRLAGGGTLANLDLAGTLAPGASAGTLTVTGNAIFRAGSVFDLEIAAAGGTDRLAVTGTATIEGGTVNVITLDPETQYTDGSRYTFLTAAGGRTGQFAALTENSAFLDFTLGYDANSAFLDIDVVRTFPDVAITFNQREASTALADFGQTAGSDSLAVYNAILFLDDAGARAAFDAASGEIYAVLLASSLREGEGLASRLLARSHAGSGEGWGLWAGAEGEDGRIDSDGNGVRLTRDAIGGDMGIDYRGAGNSWAVGFGFGYREGDTRLRDRASRASGDRWHAGGYARFGTGGAGLTLTGSAAYSSGEADVARAMAIGSLARIASAQVDVESWAMGAEGRYGFALGGGWAIGPAARIVHADADLAGFTETGAGSLNLAGGANDDGRTRAGGGAFARWEGANGAVDLSLGYLAGGGAPTEIGLAMAGAPGSAYRVRSARGDGEGATFGLAGQVELGGGWSFGGSVNGALGPNERSLAGSATLGWRF